MEKVKFEARAWRLSPTGAKSMPMAECVCATVEELPYALTKLFERSYVVDGIKDGTILVEVGRVVYKEGTITLKIGE